MIKDVSKFYGIPFDEVNAATRTVEQEVRRATTKHGDDKNLFVLTFSDAIKYSPSFNKINNILSDLDKLYNIVLNKVKENNIFEIYYEGKIIYTFADDFNHHMLTSDIVITKIKQYFSNHK